MIGRYSLRMRLALAYMCWSILLALLTGLLAHYILISRLEQQLDRELMGAAETLTKNFRDMRDLHDGAEQIYPEIAQYSYQVWSDSGSVVRTSSDLTENSFRFTTQAQEALQSR